MYHLTTLPNGLRVATAEMPHMASVCVGLWAAVGGRHEPRPAQRRGPLPRTPALQRHPAALGAADHAARSRGWAAIWTRSRPRTTPVITPRPRPGRLAQLGDVLGDLYLHSRLPAAEVERERGVIREEILMYQDQPAQVAEELLAAAVWPRHPLGRPLAGTLESVAGAAARRPAGFLARGLPRAFDRAGRGGRV